MKKVITIFIIIAMTAVSSLCHAAENADYADKLYDLGLFKGTDNGYELENTLTREQAATVLVRLLGEEANSEKISFDEVFEDVKSDRWSFPYVMYCYKNNITKGTSNNAFSPELPISADQFVTLVLRLLGYTDVEPETAFDYALEYYLLNSEIADKLQSDEEFKRGDMVYIVYRSLMTKNSGGKILADVLAEKGVITEKQAEEFDVYNSTDDINELLDKLMG